MGDLHTTRLPGYQPPEVTTEVYFRREGDEAWTPLGILSEGGLVVPFPKPPSRWQRLKGWLRGVLGDV